MRRLHPEPDRTGLRLIQQQLCGHERRKALAVARLPPRESCVSITHGAAEPHYSGIARKRQPFAQLGRSGLLGTEVLAQSSPGGSIGYLNISQTSDRLGKASLR